MIEMKYPKIETLYDRNEKFKVDPSRIRLPEFGLINKWLITEKIDGTNVRVFLHPSGTVEFRGRTDKAQFHPTLTDALILMFTPKKMRAVFESVDDIFSTTILFGEGYGPKIQKGGGNYRDDPSFRLFDVRVGEWWLNWPDVEDVALKLGIQTVPVLATVDNWLPTCKAELEDIAGHSEVARIENYKTIKPEGIVARTDPLLFRRNGQRVMWKLKFNDF